MVLTGEPDFSAVFILTILAPRYRPLVAVRPADLFILCLLHASHAGGHSMATRTCCSLISQPRTHGCSRGDGTAGVLRRRRRVYVFSLLIHDYRSSLLTRLCSVRVWVYVG